MSEHRFSRTELLIGRQGISRLHSATVAIFGLGGVGSFTAEALCRAGVGRLLLIDFDDVSLTNLNRQLHALENTIGRPKVLVMAERLRLINPAAEIVPEKEFYSAETSAMLLSTDYDYVVDAIDHITSKLHLIGRCRHLGIPIISSMGAAGKLDPTAIRVADIAETKKCRLARTMRKLLRRQGIDRGVTVVYSTEEKEDSGLRDDSEPLLKERRPTLGSISYIPPLFGITMAGVVVNHLLGRNE